MSAYDDATLDRRHAALRALADRLAASDHPAAGRLSDRYQHLVAESPASSADEIRAAHLPPTVKDLADDIAAALSEGGDEPDAASQEPTTDVPPTAALEDRGRTRAQARAQGAAAVPAEAPDAAPAEVRAPSDAPAADVEVQPVAPTPAPTPAPLAAATSASTDPLSALVFAPYDGTSRADDVASIVVARTRTGGHALSWPSGEAGSVDRLVSADRYAPYTPDAAREVARTTTGAADDHAPFDHALRHYQVWRHAGRTPVDAARTQPTLVAQAQVVAAPQSIDIAVDAGSVVTATWTTAPGTSAVAVHRVPVEDAHAAGFGHPAYRILHGDQLLGGFADHDAAPGRRYVYQLTAEIDGGLATSATIAREIEVPDIHEPVADLAFVLREDEDTAWFDLSWSTPPGGTVQVYRTTRAPAPGYDHGPIAASALDAAGLDESDRLKHPIDQADGRATMRAVPWPGAWSKAFFTAVVTVGDQAYLGNTVTGIRVPPIDRVKVIERVDKKLVTFDFPDGANDVRLYVARRGVSPEAAVAGRETAVISRQDYEHFGSMQLGPADLPQPCTLHLVAAASHGAETVLSSIASVDYDPVLTLTYRIGWTLGLSVGSRRPKVTIAAERDVPLTAGMGFVLAFRPDRLPLSIRDATAHIPVSRDEDPDGTAARFMVHQLASDGHSGAAWKADAAAWRAAAVAGGYLRLFVSDNRYQSQVALLDPPLASLRPSASMRR